MKGTLFNIQRFSTHDGPGIRTTVFFKGCSLRCVWCHNPESIAFRKEVAFHRERCIGCGSCLQICEAGAHLLDESGTHFIDRDRCTGCMRCVENCYAEALIAVGEEVTVSALMKSILTDKPYYESSGGGVTFSGGECMTQVDFLAEVLSACKEMNIHTAVDTAGNVGWESFEKIICTTDLFLFDVKAACGSVHENWTGAGNERILDNLRRLCDAGCRIFIRIPFIPGCNAEEMAAIAGTLKELPIERVELLPYHRLGEGKNLSLGINAAPNRFAEPSQQEMQQVAGIFRVNGIRVVGGK